MKANSRLLKNKKGFKLYYEMNIVDSNKPILFFLHGLGGDADAWNFVKDGIPKKEFNSIVMDLMGHGYSDHPRTFSAYNLDCLTDDIIEILEREKINKIVLIGHSYGAVIALNFAIRYPEKLEKLVVISGTYGPPHFISGRIVQKFISAIANLFAFLSPKPRRPYHSKYPVGKFHKDFEFIGLIKTIFYNSPRSYFLTFKESINLDLEHAMQKIKTPTLVIAGDKDSILRMSIPQKIHESIANSKIEIIKGGNHVVVLNNADIVSELICDFLGS